MRKIDNQAHQRFITALEMMVRDMDGFGFTDTANELVISRDELEDAFRQYNRKMEEIHAIIHIYYDLFEVKHTEYTIVARIRQKEQTRIRRKEEK